MMHRYATTEYDQDGHVVAELCETFTAPVKVTDGISPSHHILVEQFYPYIPCQTMEVVEIEYLEEVPDEVCEHCGAIIKEAPDERNTPLFM